MNSKITPVQDRYAGDIGDFMKFGLLRSLLSPSLRLGINWYRTGDENHNADGKHTGYLQRTNPHHRSLNQCDPDLMSRLTNIVATGRSVAAIELAGILPSRTLTFGEALSGAMGQAERHAWHHRAVVTLADADLVFADPDNGMRIAQSGSNPHKFAFIEELADYLIRGQSLVTYHHADRTAGGVQVQIPRRLSQLAEAAGIEPLGAVVARRGSCRFFLVVPAPGHRDELAEALDVHAERWSPHAEFVRYRSPGV